MHRRGVYCLPDADAGQLVEGIQRLVPASNGGDDGVWVLGPAEGPWLGVGLGNETLDGGLERDDGVEDAALQPPFGQLGEEALDRVEPRGAGRGVMEGPSRMSGEPLDDLGVLA